QERLDIPVFHDDQHGAAIVVLAALLNALRIVDRDLPEARIVIAGAGAAATATAELLLEAGARDATVFDEWGIVHPERAEQLDAEKRRLAGRTNPRRLRGAPAAALEGANVFIGLSAGGVLTPELLRRMAKDPIVFALANPVPEIYPEEAGPYARVIGT